jgi:ferredoxin-NADP reductase
MEKELREGMRIWVKLPYGEFIIDGDKDIVLIAGGTGITAFTAFLDGLKKEYEHEVYLFYGARRRDLLIYRRLLEQRAKEIPQLRILYFVEQDMGDTHKIEENEFLGRLSVSTLLPLIKNPLDAIFYLSGPPQMLKVLSHDLTCANIQRESIKIDAWE